MATNQDRSKEIVDILRGILKTANDIKALLEKNTRELKRLQASIKPPQQFKNLPPPRHFDVSPYPETDTGNEENDNEC